MTAPGSEAADLTPLRGPLAARRSGAEDVAALRGVLAARDSGAEDVAALRGALAARGAGAGAPEVLPVRDDLAPLFPWGGLRRGATVAVRGSRALLVALLAGAVADGGWAAVVGAPDLGVLAATEAGVPADRLALVPSPGMELVRVVAALLDGFAVVAVAADVRDSDARRLSARARDRGAVLLALGSWPGVEVELTCARGRWSGPGRGEGFLGERAVEVRARGRGAAARPVRVGVTLPRA